MARLAIVTGGTRGIGAAVARRLDRAGHKVAAIYHGNVAAAETFEHETGIKTYMWDVADFMACEAGVGAVTREFAMPVAIVINNAGITRDAMLHKMSFTQWGDVIATDLTSCFNMCRAVIASMREHGFGRIVNISSINGQKGQFGQTNYAAAKAGVLGFTKALALETASRLVMWRPKCWARSRRRYWGRSRRRSRLDASASPTRLLGSSSSW
jgi:acetoacetyl-CoA reductase